MHKIKMLCLGMSLAISMHAQVLTIKDKDTGKALEMVSILSQSPRASQNTNSEGKAEISDFKESEKIHIRLLGYQPKLLSYEEIEEGNFTLYLESNNISIDEVVVSATRWSQSTADVPSEISKISKREIQLQNPQTAADLLNISGKVFIQKSQQGGGSPMIRGFSTNRLLYTVDGVRMNTAIFRSGNLQNVISLDPFAMQSTEVLFGPGSVIYGSDAIGGVMSFQTLVPQFSLSDSMLTKGNANLRYASANNEKTGHVDVNLGWKKWASVTSISSNDYGDLKMGSHGPNEYLRHNYVRRIDNQDVEVPNDDPKVQVPSGYKQVNLMQKFRYKTQNGWEFNYGFHYSETSDYARYDRQLRQRNGRARYGEWRYGPQKWMMNNLNISHDVNTKFYDNMTLRLAVQHFEESRISRNFNDSIREFRTEQVDAYSSNLDFTKSMGSRHVLFYGFELVRNDVNSTGRNENILNGSSVNGPSRYPQATWNSYAVYLSDQYRISEKFLIQAGMRYNQYALDADFDTTFYPFPFTNASFRNDALTGSFGAIFRPSDKWIISTNAATAFRSPNVDDMGKVFDSEPGAVVVPNPNLKAEYAYSADLSVAKLFGTWLKLDASVYYTLLDNALVRRDFTLNGRDSIIYESNLSQVQAIQNAATANVYGIQAGFRLNLPAGFAITSDINFQKGEEETDDGTKSPSRHAPPLFGVSRLIYSHKKLQIQFYAQYSAERKFEDLPIEEQGKTEIYAIDAEGRPWSPAWYTLNFKLRYAVYERVSLSAGLENITDQRYRPYSSGLVAPGRNFIMALNMNF